MSDVRDLSQKIVDELSNISFSLPFTAQATQRPLTDLQELDEANVQIYSVPSRRVNTAETRGAGFDDYLVELGVITRITKGVRTEDQIFDFSDQIWEHFKNKDLPDDYHWINIQQDFIYDYKSRDKNYTVKSIFLLTYRVIKPW